MGDISSYPEMYDSVYNLLGGIDSWKNLGYPMVKD